MLKYLHVVFIVGMAFGITACDSFTSEGWLTEITAPNDEALSDSVHQRYEEDAAQLALRHLLAHSEATDAVELPDDLVQLFYRALVHVYNAEHIPERDEIVGIHTFPHYSTHEAIVGVDTTAAWTQEWRAGNRLTGQSDVDALIEEYDLSVEYKSRPFQHVAVVRSETPINILALSQQFEAIDGVVYAEQSGAAGDGNDIEATVKEDMILLTYSRGWGDCPSGCINREYWTFRVDADGTVQFVGTERDEAS